MTKNAEKMTIEELVDAMTLEEQVSLLSGVDFWSLPAITRLGLGKLRVTDGPNGARGVDFLGGVKAAAFPVGISIGSSWSPELAKEIGAAIAREVKLKSAHVALAPTVNIQRSVTNGRNFECYSEDPELSADLAVGYIEGLQEHGIAATVKHFVGNESEIERTTMSSEIDERALREVYLRPFEDAVKRSQTWAMMSAYNKVNGTYAAENHWLLTTILREEWGYNGIIMSDWFGSRSCAPTINAGLNLEMPGPPRDRGQKLVDEVKAGKVDAAQVRSLALDILRLMERTGALYDHREFRELEGETPELRALIRRAGAEGTVLLKNENALLPLANEGSVAVIGPNAKTAQIMGGGSANLNPYRRVSPYNGLVARFGEDKVSYAEGCSNYRWVPMIDNMSVEFFANTQFAGDVVYKESHPQTIATWMGRIADGHVTHDNFSLRAKSHYTAKETGTYDLGLHATSHARAFVNGKLVTDNWTNWKKGRTFFEEGSDEVVGTVELQAGETYEIVVEFASRKSDNLGFHALRFGICKPLSDADIERAVEVARSAKQVILCIGRSGEWDTEGSDIENITLPGKQDALVRAVLKANSNTVVVLQSGGPVEMPWVDDAKAILQAWYPGQEAGHAIADVLYGDVEPAGRLAQTFPKQWRDNPTHSQDPLVYPGLEGKVIYQEGVFLGYRHYDKHGITPLFPFGHGLGYTQFEMNELQVAAGEKVSVKLKLANSGGRVGSTVVQVYVGETKPSVPRPMKELKAYRKITLDPAELADVDLTLDARDFAYFDVSAKKWRVKGGTYQVMVGFSAGDIRLTANVDVPPSVHEV